MSVASVLWACAYLRRMQRTLGPLQGTDAAPVHVAVAAVTLGGGCDVKVVDGAGGGTRRRLERDGLQAKRPAESQHNTMQHRTPVKET